MHTYLLKEQQHTGAGADAAGRQANERDKSVIFKIYAPFTKCISRINGTDIDNVQNIDIAMPMYNLTEYSDYYSENFGSLWQYYKDNPRNDVTGSKSFKSKVKITKETPDDGNTKYVEIMAPSKYSSNFWITLEMPLTIVKSI